MKNFSFCETAHRFGADLFIDCVKAQTATNALFKEISQSADVSDADKAILEEFRVSFDGVSKGFSTACEDYILELQLIDTNLWYVSVSLNVALRQVA